MQVYLRMLLFALILNPIVYVTFGADDDVDMDTDDAYDYDEYFDGNLTSNETLIFTKELTNLTRLSGNPVNLRCEVQNLDEKSHVRFLWRKLNAIVHPDDRINIKTSTKKKLFTSRLRIIKADYLDKGLYTCSASNGISIIESHGILDVISDKTTSSDVPDIEITSSFPMETKDSPIDNKPVYNSSQPFCQLYEGNICKEYLENKFVFIQPPYSQRDIEQKLEQSFVVISQSNEISSSCSEFAKPSLCYSAFPICIEPKQTNEWQKSFLNKLLPSQENSTKAYKDLRNQLSMFLQRICKDDCDLLENELCRREYAIAKRHPVIGKTLELEECEFLPEEAKGNARFCLQLGVERAQDVNEDDTCFWDFGELYRGVHDTSVSGAKCIRWSHQLHLPLSEYPELFGHSYCRNPARHMQEPFCFIDQNRQEACGIPRCAKIIWLYILGVASTITSILVFCLFLYCCKKQRNKKTRLQTMNVPTVNKNIYGNTGPNSPMELNTLLPGKINNLSTSRSHQGGQKTGFQSLPHYTYKEVGLVEELGEGAFGKVYKGELKTKSGKIIVAVKSLKENASAKTQADFQREIELISELKHPNIICLLGVVIKQEPMCMLFEFMSEGDLHEFLIANTPSEGKGLTQAEFLHISLQISQGMDYLSENHYVHRDLAARNCLVTEDMVVKISDFGLSRDMYSCDYYRVQSKSLLPVRWMPPESILYGKFTTESDVWSFGVVLWEIYSYGLQPYYGYNNQEVINMIRSRKLLPCPEACPSYCYALMVECWAELAVRRPTFNEIVHRLKVWKQNGSFTGAYFKTPEVHNVQKTRVDSEPQWERHKLTESQNSLASHSSLGACRKSARAIKNNETNSLDRQNVSGKTTVVSSNGGGFQTKVAL